MKITITSVEAPKARRLRFNDLVLEHVYARYDVNSDTLLGYTIRIPNGGESLTLNTYVDVPSVSVIPTADLRGRVFVHASDIAITISE